MIKGGTTKIINSTKRKINCFAALQELRGHDEVGVTGRFIVVKLPVILDVPSLAPNAFFSLSRTSMQ